MKQHIGDCSDMKYMGSRLIVFEFYYMTQEINHGAAYFFAFIYLCFNHLNKVLLTRIQSEDILHPALHDSCIERSCYIIRSAEIVCTPNE